MCYKLVLHSIMFWKVILVSLGSLKGHSDRGVGQPFPLHCVVIKSKCP